MLAPPKVHMKDKTFGGYVVFLKGNTMIYFIHCSYVKSSFSTSSVRHKYSYFNVETKNMCVISAVAYDNLFLLKSSIHYSEYCCSRSVT